jgi:hypothetical protein
MEKKERLSFKQWCEHIWYYNKWMIILGSAVVILIVVGTIQLLTRNEGDVSFLYTGKSTITVKGTKQLEETVKGLIEDYNGDGVIAVDYLELTALAGEASGVIIDADTNANILRWFETEVRAGDSVIYLLDEYYYNRIVDIGVLAKLSDVLYEKDIPEAAIDEYGVYIGDLDIYKTPGFRELPENTVLCIRRSPEQDEITYGRNVEVYTANKLCFIELITYRHSE